MRLYLVALCAAVLSGAAPARGDHLPILVIPGRADVPEFVEGVDASWGVVEGEWGLYRPGAVAPTVIPAPHVFAPERGNSYFPSTGRRPRSGRLEVEPPPNRVLPPPAQSYHRSWGAASDPAPATIPSDPPPVIVAPSVFYGGGGGRPHRH